MMLALILLTAGWITEMLLWYGLAWRIRKAYASMMVIALAVITGIVLGRRFDVWTVLLLLVSGYRVLNLLRIVEGRMHERYLKNVTQRTGMVLFFYQLIIMLASFVSGKLGLGLRFWGWAAVLLLLAAGITLLATTVRSIRRAAPGKPSRPLADRDMPSVSVCIPARNETVDLENCLMQLIRSSYLKLEILVLDDCSQDKRTPEIIRNFAHDGVRFIAGGMPPDNWLAKNFAYKQLAGQANGDIVLFCGVDTLFSEDTIKLLVETLLGNEKSMLSVMPVNVLPHVRSLKSLLVQTGRYAWEMALPRRLFNRPPVLSTCWLIRSKDLEGCGGFDAVSRSVSPERYFARECAAKHDGYMFVSSGSMLGLRSNKTLEEQEGTALRTRYPQLHRRPELVFLVSLSELAVLIGPYVLLVCYALAGSWLKAAVALLDMVLLLVCFYKLVGMTYQKYLLQALWLQPIAALFDVMLLNYSMRQYEFDEVVWKGRNVCLPIMHVTPGLPKTD